MSHPFAVETRSLTKRYNGVIALAGLDLAVDAGSFFGLLGPNGAGKTTAVSILCTLLRPTSGEASVLGNDVERERKAVRERIGIVFQEPSLDTELTGFENLDIHARLYRIPEARDYVASLKDKGIDATYIEVPRVGHNRIVERSAYKSAISQLLEGRS